MSIRTRKYLLVAGLMVALALVVVGCSQTPQPTTAPVVVPTSAPAVVPACPTAAACPAPAVTTPAAQAPFEAQWASSPHNDAKAEAFVHWNEDEPKVVAAACAECHSTPGYQDFIGADGSAAGKVDVAPPVGTTIQCVACHNDVTAKMSSVTFLSTTKDADGKETPITISGLGPEARCMVCHQGRATKTQVDAKIAQFKATDPDAVVAPLKDGDKTTPFSFVNVHYFAAAITLYGSEVHGGYEYDGKAYDVKFDHVPGYDSCVGCHNPHTTEVKVDECAKCHEGVASKDDLKKIRMVSSLRDYNGNGDLKEGMFSEIAGLRDQLYKGIQSYAKDVSKVGIVYDQATNPYWFADKDGDGKADKDDKGANVSYNAFTPRLLKAAYNYQVSIKDPGAYAHGNKYIVQLLYDSLEDINTKLATKIDMSKMARDDAGHFAGNTMPFRDWDAEGEVPAGCAKCHSAAGLPAFIHNGGTMAVSGNGTVLATGVVAEPTVNGFQCSTCHNEAAFPEIYKVADVTFPSGAKATFGDGVAANICLECHQGRESTVSVQNALKAFAANPDQPSDKIRFKNVHYLGAGATLFGTQVKGMFEYQGNTYAGQWMHEGKLNTCTSCHEKHALTVDTNTCKGCHGTDKLADIRMNSKADYDGDGNATEGLEGELEGFQTALYTALQTYAKDVAKAPIVYDTTAYPYFFLDANGDGKGDVDAKGAPVSYNAWTPRSLQAAYNLQYSYKDPGAFVHNAPYVFQVMYDTLKDLKTKVPSVDISKMTRPTVTAAPAK